VQLENWKNGVVGNACHIAWDEFVWAFEATYHRIFVYFRPILVVLHVCVSMHGKIVQNSTFRWHNYYATIYCNRLMGAWSSDCESYKQRPAVLLEIESRRKCLTARHITFRNKRTVFNFSIIHPYLITKQKKTARPNTFCAFHSVTASKLVQVKAAQKRRWNHFKRHSFTLS